jgi:hypothetical protein
MADRWYNVPLGGDLAENVAEGAADTAQYVAVRVTYDATGNSKEQAVKAINAAVMAILQDTWPPV